MKISAEYQSGDVKSLIAILSEAANEISKLETQARSLLYENGDRTGYHELLRMKAILLSELADASPCAGLPPDLHSLVQERIGSFSFEAERALRLDSVFYMSVLLYPEDHQEGHPNELEELIDRLSSAHNISRGTT